MTENEPAQSSLFPNGADPMRLVRIVKQQTQASAPRIPTPTHWPDLPSDRADQEWTGLRSWVQHLQARFEFLDHHVIPDCWWRHNQHVEALSALRDHERLSFGAIAPATAPVEWLRALHDLTALLRTWTADLPCDATHRPSPRPNRLEDDAAWNQYVAADVRRRQLIEAGGSNPGIGGEGLAPGAGEEQADEPAANPGSGPTTPT